MIILTSLSYNYDRLAKETRQLEILVAQEKATQSKILLEQTRLDMLKFAKDNPSIITPSSSTQAPVATKIVQ
jgi:hypothetical protein